MFALGLMAKPMLVTLPFVLLLLDYWPLGRFQGAGLGSGAGGRRRVAVRLVVEKIPLLALTIGSCVATLWAQRKAIKLAAGCPAITRMSNGLVSYAAYLIQMCWPVGLAPFYPIRPDDALLAEEALAALVAIAGISVATLLWRRRYPYLPVGWFWYVGMLVPVIGVVQVGGQAMADRYTYLPQIGIYLLIAWGACDLTASWAYRRWVCGVAATVVLAALAACACRQTSYWRDSRALVGPCGGVHMAEFRRLFQPRRGRVHGVARQREGVDPPGDRALQAGPRVRSRRCHGAQRSGPAFGRLRRGRRGREALFAGRSKSIPRQS